MTMDEIAAKMARGLQKRPIEDSYKFDCGEDGAITLRDGAVTLADEPADCTIHISRENLVKLMAGDLNPMTAFAFGKIKVSGDMSLALKLGKVLG
ncbi:MAG: SCP2 sterol-binding domain-containing protein [Rhodobacteraceae bacterium]|uniref:SCP2 sterol-binding domain-containing protein n=1 Tax=Oceanicola sp. S124 TaxID=1042378 RepID=UPI000494880F|nr:SCP2 sterol-binding domain-containing protein [Oceanicola sp. S124]MBR9761990.1 SCP2 sterol-binding domain-containing protein [Paracoccaceae bacterium]MBR9821304.1 SCP2 sterol-binding domain-containing protein [Paracoccaceae bacterium]